MPLYRVAGASEYLAITGFGIKDVKLAKKAWIMPGQVCRRFDTSPVMHTSYVEAMSSDKLLFVLPVVFSIGPQIDDHEALLKYAKFISPHGMMSDHLKELVKAVIEGETRILAASMTFLEFFKDPMKLKQAVLERVQLELNQFGLFIYYANMKQSEDFRGSVYFSFLGQKMQQETADQAKVDVAKLEATKTGAIREIQLQIEEQRDVMRQEEKLIAEHLSKETVDNETKVQGELYWQQRVKTQLYKQEGNIEGQRAAADVIILENQREAVVAEVNFELAKKMASCEREAKLAQIEAANAVAIRSFELLIELERRNAMLQKEKLKAEHLNKAMVDYEMKVQEANAELYWQQKIADALLYDQERSAEGRRAAAEADFFARQKEADAQLYAKQREAEGLVAQAKAQRTYLCSLLPALGGNYNTFRDCLILGIIIIIIAILIIIKLLIKYYLNR